MLLRFVVAYWIISVGIGLYAATRVHNTKDFAIEMQHLLFYSLVAQPLPEEPEHAELHHKAASLTGHVADQPHHHSSHKQY